MTGIPDVMCHRVNMEAYRTYLTNTALDTQRQRKYLLGKTLCTLFIVELYMKSFNSNTSRTITSHLEPDLLLHCRNKNKELQAEIMKPRLLSL
jgi:hypothetical protein